VYLKHSTKESVGKDIQRKRPRTGGMEKMEVKLYNKYAYDYLYTRDGEEERE